MAREREQARAAFRSLSRRSARASVHRSPFSAMAGLAQHGQASPQPAAKQLQELQEVRRCTFFSATALTHCIVVSDLQAMRSLA